MAQNLDDRSALTIVIRLWQEKDHTGRERWCARAENIATQEVAFVQDLAGVTRFIERCTGSLGLPAGAEPVTD
jgi:hypothetical protein